ncbi:MAG: MFS transporter, partial [Alphaproteobacteria bacterium]|nr:MFS transporter [Alphaproteobacteria bacterium]
MADETGSSPRAAAAGGRAKPAGGGAGKPFGAGGWRPQPKPGGLDARLSAAHLLAGVMQTGVMLEERPAHINADNVASEEELRDRALARSIAIVSLRRLGTIRLALAKFLDKGLPKKAPALEWILVTGAAQILFMDTPDHAAVDLAVHACKQDRATAPFAPLANAVLRNVARQKSELLAAPEPFADTPKWLAVRWQKNYGLEKAVAIAAINAREPALDLSVRSDASDWAARLDGIVLPNGSVRLRSHTPVSALEGYQSGAWWVQDVAASLPARLLNVHPGESVADLCAAPGGKTIQLALAGAQVVALDKSAERMKRLASNLERIGVSAQARIGDALNFSGGPFDAILLDAPCTATG